jgi:ABC-2 type transport system ATP-binding protein
MATCTRDDLVIACSGVARRAGGQPILDDVNLRLTRGELHALIGANGSGKTTLMRIVLGLVRAQSGTVLVFGAPPASAGVARRIGASIDTPSLYPWMSGRTALRTLLGTAGLSDDGRVDAALARFGLGDAGRKLIRRYSQGMRKRLSLAASMLLEPDLLVLDEPTNGLDAAGRALVVEWLTHARAAGTTVLLATHFQTEVAELATHATYLEDGRVIAAGAVSEVLAAAPLRGGG